MKILIRSLQKEGIVIIDCWAEWCGACKTFEPVFEKVSLKTF